MHELTLNLHMHTTYSDGSGSHEDIAQAALRAGIDAVIVTDHNVWVNGVDGYRAANGRRMLLIVGEEVHDRTRQPQKNHLLVFGANREMTTFAPDPQNLIRQVEQAGGLSFIAHPWDPALPMFGEDDISWEAWDVEGYNGFELWNGLSELKTVVKSRLHGVFYALFPQYLAHAPLPQTLAKYDELLSQGRRLTAVGGSDAHALHMHMGPLHRVLYPYEFHFRAINNHLLTPRPLGENLLEDRRMIYDALRAGRSFIGYDLPHPTHGFRFTAQGLNAVATLGEEIPLQNSITFQIRLPAPAYCRLLCNGKPVKAWRGQEICSFIASQPGAYRVEAYLDYLGKRRGWIFSNPIYVRAPHPRARVS